MQRAYYTSAMKGRFGEANIHDDHLLVSDSYTIPEVEDGRIVNRQVPALTALNARLRDDFTREVQAGLDRWNRIPEKHGIPFRLTLPHVGFNRKIGTFAGQFVSPDGRVLSKEDWERHTAEWLPSHDDHAFVNSLMGRIVEPGKFANWIAPPARGINDLSADFEYVRFA